MPYYVKMNPMVEAYQWFAEGENHTHVQTLPDYGVPVVETPDGIREVREGDWIVTQPDGTVLLFRDGVFQLWYQEV